jgi:hypothetical protein
MPTWTIPPLFVLLPILVLGVINGLRRGWKDEAWACGGLLLTVAIVSRPESVLLPTLERVISVFLRAGQELIGRDTSGPSFVFPDEVRPWAVILAFLVFASLAYSIGHLVGKGEIGKGLWKLLGGLIGGLNFVIIAVWLATQLLAKRPDGLARLTLPSFEGRDVVFGSPTANNVMASWPGLIGLLLVVILIVVLLTRARVWR